MPNPSYAYASKGGAMIIAVVNNNNAFVTKSNTFDK